MSKEFCQDRPSIRCPVEAHCSVFSFVATDQRAFKKHRMVGLSCRNSLLIRRKIQRNLKMTVFQEMVIE